MLGGMDFAFLNCKQFCSLHLVLMMSALCLLMHAGFSLE